MSKEFRLASQEFYIIVSERAQLPWTWLDIFHFVARSNVVRLATKCSVCKSQRSSKMIIVTGSKAVDCIPDVNTQFNSIQLLPPLERFNFVLSGGLGKLNHDYNIYLKDGY
jgi:hypothetical protein